MPRLLQYFVVVFLLLDRSADADDPEFLAPPAHTGPPKSIHAMTNRAFQGIPSMAVSTEGRLWATWYAGKTPAEDHNNYVTLTTSGDNGRTWREVLVVDPDEAGPVRAYDPELWMAPDGALRLVWAQAIGHEGTVAGVWFLRISNPDSDRPNFSSPERVTDGIMMCKPLVLSSGDWALPASTWRKTDHSARMIVSTDQGKTWNLRGACNVPISDRAFDEHMFIELKDGSLWLLARTRYGIGESLSTDGGRTWPELTPSAISHPSARFFIRRLQSGNLLLVKHGSIEKKIGRSHLTAFVSKDDGRSWKGGLMLDERSGVSYPDGQQTADGLIRIIYDYSRTGDRNILMATFGEEDVAAGKPITAHVQLRQLVSKASGGEQKPLPTVRKNADGVRFVKSALNVLNAEKFETVPLKLNEKLFTDRGYVLEHLPETLKGMRFIRVPIEGRKTFKCRQAGPAWFLTPAPDRNRDSQTEALIEQGFTMVAHPEVRLFNPQSTANFCTLYQKQCEAGEVVTSGKWAVPLIPGSAN